jgi:eukaryotic-like serine/threonine-protein kinase
MSRSPAAISTSPGGAAAQRGLSRTSIGRYLVLDRLGAGGMGTVYVAYDPELDRRVALKVLRADRADSDIADVHRARLQREAKALAQLSHPNIVTVYDVGTVDHHLFIAMELIDGSNARVWLRAAPRGLEEILTVFSAAADGLAAAHAAGIVHRDFKPDNVVVSTHASTIDRVVVLDFGLAHEDQHERSPHSRGEPEPAWEPGDSLTRTGRTMGTPAYMAPEQHLGEAIDARTDQYSWCISLWEAVCGMRPFGGRATTMVRNKSAAAIVPPDPRGPLPAWLYPVLVRGLSARPEQRFRSMHELLDAIALARPRPRRRRAAYLLAGASLLVGLAIIPSVGDRSELDHCALGEQRLAQVWNPVRREAIAVAFAASGVGYAEVEWSLLHPRVDDYAVRWRGRWQHSCDSPAQRELQCLERGLQALSARLELLDDPSAETIENATRMIAELPPPDRCRSAEPGVALVDPAIREQVATVRVRLAEVEALELAGRYAEGLEHARLALAEAMRSEWVPLHAEALLRVGRLHKALGEYEQAQQVLTDAAWTAVASRHDEVAAQAMIELVVVVGRELSRPEQGRRWSHDAAAAITRAGADELLEANLLSNLGLLQFREGAYEDARRGDELALAIRTRVLGREHPAVALSHNNLGSDLWVLGRHDQAEQHLREAIAILEAVLGPEHPRLAASLDNLGALLAERGELDAARPLIERALEIRERALGPEHPAIADTLINLGNLYHALGQLDRAEALFERAQVIAERGGVDNPTLATCLSNLAGVQLARGQYAAAEQNYARAVVIYEAVLGPDHVKVGMSLANLGEVLRLRGELERAIEHDTRALAIVERALGPEHPQTAYPLEGLGRALLAAGEPARAIEPLARALAIESRLDVVHGDRAALERDLARARAQAGARAK